MVLDTFWEDPEVTYSPDNYQYPVVARISSVDTDKGTCNLKFLDGGDWDDVPLDFAMVGEEGWGILAVPTPGTWVWVIVRPFGVPCILPYRVSNYEYVLSQTNLKKLKAGEILIRSKSGAEIDLQDDGSITISDQNFGYIRLNAPSKLIELDTDKRIKGRASNTRFRFGLRDYATGEIPALPTPAVLQTDGFEVTVNKQIPSGPAFLNREWLRIEGGDLTDAATHLVPDPLTSFRIQVNDRATALVPLAKVEVKETGEVKLDALLTVNVGTPGADAALRQPVARNHDLSVASAASDVDFVRWMAAVHTFIVTSGSPAAAAYAAQFPLPPTTVTSLVAASTTKLTVATV